MDRFLRSHLAACQLDGAVGDDFVDIHVGLRSAAGLPDAQGKLVVEFACNNFVGSSNDQLGFFSRKLAQILIDQRACLLEDAERADQLRRHGVASNIEMEKRPLSLRAPIDIGRDFDLSHAVGFNAGASRLFSGRRHFVFLASEFGR